MASRLELELSGGVELLVDEPDENEDAVLWTM
jgi:hypothetical protein